MVPRLTSALMAPTATSRGRFWLHCTPSRCIYVYVNTADDAISSHDTLSPRPLALSLIVPGQRQRIGRDCQAPILMPRTRTQNHSRRKATSVLPSQPSWNTFSGRWLQQWPAQPAPLPQRQPRRLTSNLGVCHAQFTVRLDHDPCQN